MPNEGAWRDAYLDRVLCGHALDLTPGIPDGVFHCCVTSPPYWGQRDYKCEAVVWGGDNGCEHEWGTENKSSQRIRHKRPQSPNWCKEIQMLNPRTGQFCARCGGWRGQLGLEPTPELYVQHVVEVCREIKRTLRPDGTFWLVLGDSYASGKGTCYNPGGGSTSLGQKSKAHGVHPLDRGSAATLARAGLKPKDLVGIPWTIALALRADGWWFRSDNIWYKKNTMPSSVRSRTTVAHEYVFMFTKAGTPQYWTHRDHNGTRKRPLPDYRYEHATGYEVVEEPAGWRTSIIACPFCGGTGLREIPADGLFDGFTYTVKCEVCDNPEPDENEEDDRPRLGPGEVYEWKRVNLWCGHDYFYDQDAVREANTYTDRRGDNRIKYKGRGPDESRNDFDADYFGQNPAGRNLRSVWEIPTKSYSGAHFATFPPELARRCIVAGSPTRVCAACGAGWERITEKGELRDDPQRENRSVEAKQFHGGGYGPGGTLAKVRDIKTVGFRPTCGCDDGAGKAIVFDPFMGSGTVAQVAHENFRHYVGLEINPAYIPLAEGRGLKQKVIF